GLVESEPTHRDVERRSDERAEIVRGRHADVLQGVQQRPRDAEVGVGERAVEVEQDRREGRHDGGAGSALRIRPAIEARVISRPAKASPPSTAAPPGEREMSTSADTPSATLAATPTHTDRRQLASP